MNKYLVATFTLSITLLLSSCEEKSNTLFKLIDSDDSGISFVNTIEESDTFNILTQEYIYNGGGVGIGDFNNDGLSDVFFVGNTVPNKMYINKGSFEFEDITETASVNVAGRWNSGVVVVDINNDGWLDIYVTATLKPRAEDRRNMLFVNNGLNKDGIPTFSEKASEYKIDDNGFSVMAAFFDYDLDGDLDLYVLTNERLKNLPSNYRPKIVDGSSPNNDRLYRNNGDNTFTQVTKDAGILIEGFGLGLAVCDFNKDGWPDIYVSNDYTSNDLLYINNGNGTFSNQIGKYIAHQSQFSMGNDAADINNDAWPDLITVDMLPETNARKKTVIGNKTYQTNILNEKYGYEYQYIRNMLHINNGLDQGIKFSEVGQLAGVYQTDWSWSALFADLDNDGNRDLVITNGFPKDVTDKDFSNYRNDIGQLATPAFLNDSIPIVKNPNYAFRNSGALKFDDYTTAWGLTQLSFTNGASFADFDNDGDLDYVMNNINEKAFLYENTLYSNEQKERSSNYLRIRLKGAGANIQGIGTKITVYYNNQLQYYEHAVSRGFLSSVDDVIHFGLDKTKEVDSIVVEWPGRKWQVLRNVAINQVLTIAYKPQSGERPVGRFRTTPKLFTDITAQYGESFKHSEKDFIDFNTQRTLPHKFSQSGPGIAVGDINKDGLEDFVIGGSVGHHFAKFVQGKNGTFHIMEQKAGMEDVKNQEDEGLLLFDADGDGDLDLYIVSGGVEGQMPADYQDKLYRNGGDGEFQLDKTALPELTASGSCVRAADYDSDGDLDLFVGGRVVPASYPLPAKSYLLKNEKGKFVDVTADVASELQALGLVNDAVWSDYDADGTVDLVVAGEFMPVTFLKNDGGKFKKHTETGIAGYTGWWNSVSAADFDNDGDMDYVLGNLGLNNSFQVTPKTPMKIFAKDIDNNGSIDPVLACYVRESLSSPERKLFAVHFWDELNQQSPKFRRKFTTYKQFSKATMENLLKSDELEGSLTMEANFMSSAYAENQGGGKFVLKALPIEAQVSPVNGVVLDDVNNDGNQDIMLTGNDYGNEVFVGRYDAFIGLVLLGNGKGEFAVLPAAESGFYVGGDAKALARLCVQDKDIYLATQNLDSLKVFTVIKAQAYFKPESLDVWAEVIYTDGHKQRVEFQYGSGHLSQSTRRLRLATGVTELIVYDSKGKSRKVTASSL